MAMASFACIIVRNRLTSSYDFSVSPWDNRCIPQESIIPDRNRGNPNVICYRSVVPDPFADAIKGSDDDVQDGLVHIRIQQRNGRKTLTTVQGLSSEYDLKKIVRACKKVTRSRKKSRCVLRSFVSVRTVLKIEPMQTTVQRRSLIAHDFRKLVIPFFTRGIIMLFPRKWST